MIKHDDMKFPGHAVIDAENKFYKILKQIGDLLNRKNSDYGDSYAETRDEFGDVAFVLRLTDKYKRLKTLMGGNPALVSEESIEDTISDIIGYCTLELKYRRERGVKNG
jgi:hypothetical protein